MTVRAANTHAGCDDLSTCGDGRWSNVMHFVGLLMMLTILSVLASNTPVFADSGESIAIDGGSGGATACTVCHRPGGTRVGAVFPRLAGQLAGLYG